MKIKSETTRRRIYFNHKLSESNVEISFVMFFHVFDCLDFIIPLTFINLDPLLESTEPVYIYFINIESVLKIKYLVRTLDYVCHLTRGINNQLIKQIHLYNVLQLGGEAQPEGLITG